MISTFKRFPEIFFLLVSLVFAVGCWKKDIKREPAQQPAQLVAETAFAPQEAELEESEASLRDKVYAADPESAVVYFDFDKSELSEETRKSLKENAAALKKRSTAEIQVAGHCDERGTTEYNLALGQRRANAVRDYYKHQGIRINRMSTISFGEEKPVCVESNDDCWAKNRRVETLIKEE